MNCNPCCGCFPPITTYNPSVADNFPTILQQVEYLKAMLKKYPSQQWFISTEKVTPETVTITTSSIVLHERPLQESDFILATSNDDKATILLFQYVGASSSTLSVVEYVGVFSNQIVAEQALTLAQAVDTKAQQALDLAKTNEKDIGTLDGQVAQLETKTEVLPDNKPVYQVVLCSNPNNKMYYVVYNELSVNSTTIPIFNSNGRLRSKAGGTGDEVATMADIEGGERHFEQIYTNGLHINSSVPIYYDDKMMLVPNTQMSPILLENGIKTIFGNKSLVGTGNIDLYRHHINITGQNEKFNFKSGEIYIDFISSNNLNVDSLTDLKTLLGNTFKIQAYGGTTKALPDNAAHALYMNESNLTIIDEITNVREDASLSFLSFTDNVTTI